MSTHIEITGGGTRHNVRLRAFVDALRNLRETSEEIVAGYRRMTNNGSDFTELAKQLNLQIDVEGQTQADTATADAIYNLILAADIALNERVPNQETPLLQVIDRMT